MIVPYLLVLLVIPSWGEKLSRLDRICEQKYCKLKSENVYMDYQGPAWLVIHLELSSCQDHDLQMVQLTPRLRQLVVLNCDGTFTTRYLDAPPHLDTLRLRLGNVTEMPPLAKMSSLEELDLRGNGIVRVPDDTFRELNNLKELYLQDNLIEQLPGKVFHPLAMLELLDLSNNRISQLSDTMLPRNSKVQNLYLSGNPLTTLEFFYGSPPENIVHIDLSDCREIRGELEFKFPFASLSLAGSSVESLSTLGLVQLDAANSKIKKLDLSIGFALQELNLRGTNLTWSNVRDILCDFNNLEVLDLSNNSIDFIPLESNRCFWGRLRKLNLSRNLLRHLFENPRVFGARLTWLDLSHNQLESIDMEVFAGAYDLEMLFLQGNRLHEFEYRSDKLHSLKELALYDNDMDVQFCKAMEGYFDNHHLKLHRSPQGYACKDQMESLKCKCED